MEDWRRQLQIKLTWKYGASNPQHDKKNIPVFRREKNLSG